MKKSFFYLMVILPIFTIIFVSIAIILVDDQKYSTISKYYNDHILQDHINDNKKEIKDKVEFVNNIIEFEISQLEAMLTFELSGKLSIAHQTIENIYKKNKDELTNEEIREKVIDYISTIEYNGGSGYFYIIDYSKNIMLSHPLDRFVGLDVSNSIDAKGNNRTNVLKNSLRSGEKFGFSKIYFPKPNDKEQHPKLSGVFHFKPLDILVGTGEYLDFVKERIKIQVMKRVELLNNDQKIGIIRLIEYDETNNSFECILGSMPCTYLVNNTDYPLDLKKIVTDVNTEYKGFIKHKDDDIVRYIYYLYHKDWNWVIQSDFYEDDMMYSLNSIQNLIKDNEDKIFKNSLFIIVVFVIITLLISFVVLNKIRSIMFKYTQEIKEQKDELEIIFSTTKDGIAILDLETNFLYFNESYSKMLGYEKDELLSFKCLNITAQEDIENVKKAIAETIEKGFYENLEKTFIVKNDRRVSVNMSLALLPDKQRMLVSIKDITGAKKREKQIKNYVSLIDKYIITSSTDIEGNITNVSKAFSKISGYTKEELLGKKHNILKHPDISDSLFKELWSTIVRDEVWSGELKNKNKNGGYYWVDITISPNFNAYGKKVGYTAIHQDITDKKRIEEISVKDGLTGVYNRRYFEQIVPKLINSAKREDEMIAFIALDIDYFKQYNDTYGHQAGDEVLIKVAHMLDKCLNRADDYCFRLGGEEFGLIYKAKTRQKALHYAEIIRKSIEGLKIEHEKNSASKYLTVSMGLICDHASKIKDKEVLYRKSDDLLYKAKESGRNKVCIEQEE